MKDKKKKKGKKGKKYKLDKKNMLISLFFIFLLGGSIVTYALMSSLRSQQSVKPIEIPQTNVINFELTTEQEMYLIQRGITIIKLYSKKDCVECIEWRKESENLADMISNQIMLEEIDSDENRIVIYSIRGSKDLLSPKEKDITRAVCELLWDPPGWCVEYTV